MGNLGFQELILILIIGILIIALPVYFIYKYGKNKGRIQELERKLKDKETL